MIIKSLELENWRVFREPHRFEFEPGFNLLVGSNEAGKSTLLKALTILFFKGYASGGGGNSRSPSISELALTAWISRLSLSRSDVPSLKKVP